MEHYRIMVVDDSKFIVTMISALLKKNNYNVKGYLSAKEAISEVDSFNPHLIISDYMMPEMDGFKFCTIIKSDEHYKDIKFILLTGLDEVDAKVKCFEVGADDYILKPFNNEEIIARVKTHISIKQLQDDLKKALKKIEDELEIVGKIQKGLLPKNSPEIPNINFDFYYNSYAKSGGDYFDFIDIDPNHTGVLIVDVSGHGTSSTVIMTIFKIFFTKVLNGINDPADVINRLNEEMLQLMNIDKFATIFYGNLNKKTLEFKFCNAAHPNPFIVNRVTRKISEIKGKTGLPCGILPTATGSYVNNSITFEANDRVVLFTDGILEARTDTTDIYGEKRFKDIVSKTANMSLSEAKEKIIQDVLSFSGNKLDDDITMLMFDVE